VSGHRAQTSGAVKPLVLVPLFVAVAIAGATLPRLLGYAPYRSQAIEQQIDREDAALCETFGFASGATQHGECKARLAELRQRRDLLLLN
jgi:hypothetical protein